VPSLAPLTVVIPLLAAASLVGAVAIAPRLFIDTLSIAVWEATKESRFDVAALPALLIILAGMVPVVVAIRLSRG